MLHALQHGADDSCCIDFACIVTELAPQIRRNTHSGARQLGRITQLSPIADGRSCVIVEVWTRVHDQTP